MRCSGLKLELIGHDIVVRSACLYALGVGSRRRLPYIILFLGYCLFAFDRQDAFHKTLLFVEGSCV